MAPPRAAARLLPAAPTTPPTATSTPPPSTASDDVVAIKLDWSCVEKRAHLSFADVLRQIGRTLQNPFSALAEEAQVVYFYENLGRCPTPEEAGRLAGIFGAVDKIVSMIVGLLPHSQPFVLSQACLAPLLQLIADDLDGLAPDTEQTADAVENAIFLARSMVAAAPRDRAGKVISERLAPPAKTRFDRAGPHTEIDGESWRLAYRDGTFIASRDGRTVEVEYHESARGWRFRKQEAAALQMRGARPAAAGRRLARVARRFGVTPSAYQPVAHAGEGTLYAVTLQGSTQTALCAQLGQRFVPVRLDRAGVMLEAYDRRRPRKAGYPLSVGSDGGWRVGRRVRLSAKLDEETSSPRSHLSDRLREALPRQWTVRTDTAFMHPTDSRGMLQTEQGRRYLRVEGGVVPIERHRLIPNLHQIGPAESDKVLCVYDREQRRFLLVPEERGFASTAIEQGEAGEAGEAGDRSDELTELLLGQRRMAARFRDQRSKATYREGYRTARRDEYPRIAMVDAKIEDASKRIVCYGLGNDELAVAGKYAPAAAELKQAVIDASRRMQTLAAALRQAEAAQRPLARLFELIGGQVDEATQKYIRRQFRRRVVATARLMSDHVADDCARIWLADLHDGETYGLTLKDDPLHRIIVNVKASGAYRSGKTGCGLGCGQRVSDDVATIIHEASHLGAGTDDIFYMDTPQGARPLTKEIERMSAGRLTRRETRQLLNLAMASRRQARPPTGNEQAADLFNTRPELRAQLLMSNADSFAQMVLELSDGLVSRPVRSTETSLPLMKSLLSGFAAQALWHTQQGKRA
ncbi:hypothetical protein [Chitinasiproducens palmae]|uniref:hypothetical protein n=1 Tax=Chitinasiproducens palmae TaxID=1770053 RepID=UPI000B83713E|nr:hypothetical protein [Chitinasiproducens palmae]